ncbi:MAG: GTPase Era [Zetaproteobacteria bacterium]|nr:MAG: GTPase Era [Zetaproteobacteria bacterium]
MQTEQGFRCGKVALLGRPNVGKSTLMNHLIGAKAAIVTPKPQTTRHRILGIYTDEHRQIIFVDTPGIHKGKFRMNRSMVRTAYAAAEEADVLVIMQDASRPLDAGTRMLIERFAKGTLKKPRFHVLNKIDRVPKLELLPRIDLLRRLDPEAKGFIPLSARKGIQTERLLDAVTPFLPVGEAVYDPDWFTDQSQRMLVAEYVREQVFLAMHQEIPFHTAVDVESFREDAWGVEIDAVILVGAESHKPMLIGKGGQRLKLIGTRAREELERLLGCRVRLNLWVKVDPGWFDSPAKLTDLGIHG